MCQASNVQYVVCGCYHGCKATSTCPRGMPLMDHCPDFSAQGVTRREGYCPACRCKNAQKASHGHRPDTDDVWNLREVMRRVMIGPVARPRIARYTPAFSPGCVVFCLPGEAASTHAKGIGV
jgi:hypothetical protein